MEWDDILRTLADHPNDYEREGGAVLFTRHGEEYVLTLVDVPGAGLCIRTDDGIATPISSYIQRSILGLPRLAKQMIAVSDRDRASNVRPVPFVEGPATLERANLTATWVHASASLQQYLHEAEPGTTQLLELMAPAGRGKTMLLETVSRALALSYQPDPYPTPLLLKVDLLGRYVGTIDDAIAGSLNNEYFFPGLSQKDVALAVRRRWLILALDGFDELVARVGSRDAFSRITELLDQLEGQGTVILSARESFFELYQVTAAIKTYLQPRRGSYTTSVIKLDRWGPSQGEEVFRKLGSADPLSTFADLAHAFRDDEELIFHPFFLTRLAKLWMAGERFSEAAGQDSSQGRTQYVIETFVDREAREKWIDRDGNPLIPAAGHAHLLGGIAEEMWRSGAFALDIDELRLAAQLGADHLRLPPAVIEGALERIPTHAALVTKERKGTSFLHDRFLHYFVGFRIAHLLAEGDTTALRHLLSARELIPDVGQWTVWTWRSLGVPLQTVIGVVQSLAAGSDDTTLKLNASDLAARLCDGAVSATTSLHGFDFVGDSCRAREYLGMTFDSCKFWHADLSATRFANCLFTACELGDVKIDAKTDFSGSVFRQGTIASVDVEDEWLFTPELIINELRRKGMVYEERPLDHAPAVAVRSPSRDRMRAISGLVRASTKTWDVAQEEMESSFGRTAVRAVIKAALKNDVVKEVNKATAGPKKTFVRFTVDREKLLQGATAPTGDIRIDAFWNAIAEE